MSKEETTVKGFRLRTETLLELDKIRAKKFGEVIPEYEIVMIQDEKGVRFDKMVERS